MKRHALFVGVDQYADGRIPNLSCAVSDATDLHGFFKYGAGYDRVELLQNPAVKQDILDAVQEMTSDLKNGDFFLFFFAGHGFRVGENHILVCNRDLYDDVKHVDAGLRLGHLKRRLSGSFDSALFLDACQSDILQTRGGEGIAERDLSLIHEAPEDRTCGGALTIVTSCDAGQTAAELSEEGHGLFTMAMLDLLKEAQGAHQQIDLSDAFRRSLGQRMCAIASRSGLSVEQRPRFSCTGDSCAVLLDGIAAASPAFSLFIGDGHAAPNSRDNEEMRAEERRRIAAIRAKEEQLASEEKRIREERARQEALLVEKQKQIERERRLEEARLAAERERIARERREQATLRTNYPNVVTTDTRKDDPAAQGSETRYKKRGTAIDYYRRRKIREWIRTTIALIAIFVLVFMVGIVIYKLVEI